MGPVSFREALDAVEALSEEERWELIDIVKRRLVDARREELAGAIQEARERYRRGDIKRGTVDDFLRELSE